MRNIKLRSPRRLFLCVLCAALLMCGLNGRVFATDTVILRGIPSGDTVGGRRNAFSVALEFSSTSVCTTIFEYDTYNSNQYDSITFIDSEWGPGQTAPDSTPTLSTGASGDTYTFHWNVQADKPDTRIPSGRLRVRVWDAVNGTSLGETILTPIGLVTVLVDPPDTPDAISMGWGESVQIRWYQDTLAKYYTVWRDTGYPPNDTKQFINVTKMVLGTDSQADNRGLLLNDTNVGKAPGKRTPTLDTSYYWYITAIDTWGNTQELLRGYGDSIPAEYIYVRKIVETGASIGGRASDTIPGATLQYHILVSNTPGYSPAQRVQVIDGMPYNSDYKGTSVEIDTRHGFIAQTDINDADYTQFLYDSSDSPIVQVTLFNPFNPGDTARIRFKVIIR